MNLVGKIFTVLICVMSIFFAAFAATLHSTHKNWKEEAAKHEASLKKAQEDNETMDAENQRLRKERQKERAAYAAASAAQLAEVKRLTDQYNQLVKDMETVSAEKQTALAATAAAEASAKQFREQTDDLVADKLTAQEEREQLFKEVVIKSDDLHVAVNEVKRLRRLQMSLTEQLSKATEVLRMFGLVGDYIYGDPPMIDGLVLSVPSADLVTVSLGHDDGLINGHFLDIYRTASGTSTYVGRIEVVKTQPDTSICKVAQLKSPVRRGDSITTRLQNYKYVTVKLHQ